MNEHPDRPGLPMDEGVGVPLRPPPPSRRERMNAGVRQTAGRIETAAQRLERLANERLTGAGPRGRAGRAAHTVAGRMGSAAGYLREHEVDDVRGGLERHVREHPLQSLMVGVAAGWLLGRIIR